MADEDIIDDKSSALGSTDSAECAQTRHNWETDASISMSIITAVSAVTGIKPMATTPLSEFVDPDALDQLMASIRGDERGGVTLSIDGCEVTVRGNGMIEVRP